MDGAMLAVAGLLLVSLVVAPAVDAGIPVRCYPNPDALPQVHWRGDPDTGVRRPYVTYEPGADPIECVY